VKAKHEAFHAALDRWWDAHVAEIKALPETGSVFAFRRRAIESIADALLPEGLLTAHQIRGAFASFMKNLEAEFKSIAASGWTPELIPEDPIVRSQFPEVLDKLEQDRARVSELEALFAAADAADDEPDDEEGDENGVLPSSRVKELQAERKELRGQLNEQLNAAKNLAGEAYDAAKAAKALEKGQTKTVFTKGLKLQNTDPSGLDALLRILDERLPADDLADRLRACRDNARQTVEAMDRIDRKLENHEARAKELKDLKAAVRDAEKRKDDLVAAAREKIGSEEARRLILDQLRARLREQYDALLQRRLRIFVADVENLWDKYAVTAEQIVAGRDREAEKLNGFLKELGYV